MARDGLCAVAALADDFDVVFLLQQRQHALARHRLVVDDQGSDLVHATLSMSDRSGPSASDCPVLSAERDDDRHGKPAAGRRVELEAMAVAVEVLEPRPRVGQADALVKRVASVEARRRCRGRRGTGRRPRGAR